MNKAETLILDEVPPQDRAFFPKVFDSCYKAVAELRKETPFLRCPTAPYTTGHLIALAVDYGLSQLIECGKWKVEGYDWPYYARPTGRYLRVFTKNGVITVSQLPDTTRQPRQATFRENGAYDPQEDLFLLPGERNLKLKQRPHLLLVHGHQTLDFIHVAVPNPEKDEQRPWLAISPNILTEIRDVSADTAPVEGPQEVTEISIKEQIKRRMRDDAS